MYLWGEQSQGTPPTGFYSGMLHVLASALVTYFTAINCDFKQNRASCYCSRGAQRVLRYGDREYVMLHLIFIYLMPGEGQPAAYAASDL